MGETDYGINIVKQVAEESWASGKIEVIKIFETPLNFLINNSTAMYNVVSTVGIILMVVFFMISLQDVVMDKNFNVEILFRNFMKLIIGVAIVTNIGSIVLALNDFVIAVSTDLGFQTQVSLSTDFLEAKNVATRFNKVGMPVTESEGLEMGSIVGIAWFMKMLIYIVVWVVAIKRAIELSIYYIISPIIFSDIFTNRIIGAAGRLKRILGVYMELPFVMLTISFGDIVVKRIAGISQSGSAILITVLALFTVLKTVGSAKSYVQTIFSA